MTQGKSRYQTARKVLIFWCLFIDIGALWGGTAMLLRPDGSLLQMQAMLPYFQKLPFSEVLFTDYVFSGIALLCVNGVTNIAAAVLLFRKHPKGILWGTIFGITLMLWICIQFYMFPANVLSTAYFVFGFCQAATGWAAWVFAQQEQFSVDPSTYQNIGTNKRELVVYFSRMGYTQKVACEEADRLGADLLALTTPEPTKGTGGFWWCGYFALTGKDMPIDPIPVDLTQYAHITLCAPIWVFRLCPPMQTFCKMARGQVKSVSYILLHHTRAAYAGAVRKADRLLALSHADALSLCCRRGRIVKKERI